MGIIMYCGFAVGRRVCGYWCRVSYRGRPCGNAGLDFERVISERSPRFDAWERSLPCALRYRSVRSRLSLFTHSAASRIPSTYIQNPTYSYFTSSVQIRPVHSPLPIYPHIHPSIHPPKLTMPAIILPPPMSPRTTSSTTSPGPSPWLLLLIPLALIFLFFTLLALYARHIPASTYFSTSINPLVLVFTWPWHVFCVGRWVVRRCRGKGKEGDKEGDKEGGKEGVMEKGGEEGIEVGKERERKVRKQYKHPERRVYREGWNVVGGENAGYFHGEGDGDVEGMSIGTSTTTAAAGPSTALSSSQDQNQNQNQDQIAGEVEVVEESGCAVMAERGSVDIVDAARRVEEGEGEVVN
ncbi:hypothetical protein BDV95DRAFT_61656 [Massariosphaeria phaeospora]|uniref:Uncharacterized protein n=1 Tax=Massariosphaeria phaeospora TaxID=100035 RepID=A0A7C8IDK1_9PLEO|nr:hypothetical protein BDV95DRAFT_61656 [Massariosphaeria phaeospora]